MEPREQFDYVLTVSNAEGADAATNVQVEDELPLGVTFDGHEAPAGVSCIFACRDRDLYRADPGGRGEQDDNPDGKGSRKRGRDREHGDGECCRRSRLSLWPRTR